MRTEVVVLGGVCGVGIVAAVGAIVRWGGREARFPAMPALDAPARDVVGWWVRVLAIVVWTGILAGIPVAGLGGRLAMRIVAATAGASAQGKLTEAEAEVGRITLEGTIFFMLFVGMGFGLVSAAFYFLVHRVVPRHRLGGLTVGAALLVLFATRFDPLRPDNRDFDIVGPDWVSVTVFGSLAVLMGLTTAAVAAAVAARVPAPKRHPRTWAWYLPLVLLAAAPPLALLAIAGGALAVLLHHSPGFRERLGSVRVHQVAQALAGLVIVVSLPNFVRDVAAIL